MVEPEVKLVVSSADIDVLNTAIVGYVNEKPADRRARMLYERWASFAASPARQRPDAELAPVLHAFATTYRAARGDASGRVGELAGEPVALEAAGKRLDLELARVGQFGPKGADFMKKPWVLLLGGVLTYKLLKKGKRK